jgi:hypothetical protein
MLIIHVYDYDGLMNIPYTCYSGTHPPALSPVTRVPDCIIVTLLLYPVNLHLVVQSKALVYFLTLDGA